MYLLTTPLSAVKGIGPQTAKIFSEAGLQKVIDLLLFLPLRYDDRSQRGLLASSATGQTLTFKVKVLRFSHQYKGRRSIARATLEDESGRANAIWFNNPYLKNKVRVGESYLMSGQINDRGMLVQATVESEGETNLHTDRIVPLYSQRLGLKIGTLRRLQHQLISNLTLGSDWLDGLPSEIIKEHPLLSKLPDLKTTFATLHFPESEDEVISARERLALEEMLQLIKHSHQLKDAWKGRPSAPVIATKVTDAIPPGLPFELTADQVKAIEEGLKDLGQPEPMNRLLIGDVGSGKTVVAAALCRQIIASGHKAALIAPTQILAGQHFETLSQYLPDTKIGLLTGKNKLEDGENFELVVGTHAVLNQVTKLKPALMIIDEQHRFGVLQRSSALAELNFSPHLLTMTATPIPRSYMLTIFAHLKLSQLATLPPGRLPTKTWLVGESKRQEGYHWLAKQIMSEKSQVLHVCPFVNTSSVPGLNQVASASDQFEKVQKFLSQEYPQIRVALLHGQLSSGEKYSLTKRLYQREIDWLITTPIIEVGLDLKAANTVIIEGAERFGLASLHQLRGRVGRAGQQGYCLLLTTKQANQENQRLTTFCQENSGFALAEFDLKQRGAGDIFGLSQHGTQTLKFADWANLELITSARVIYDQHLSKLSSDWTNLPLSIRQSKELPAAN